MPNAAPLPSLNSRAPSRKRRRFALLLATLGAHAACEARSAGRPPAAVVASQSARSTPSAAPLRDWQQRLYDDCVGALHPAPPSPIVETVLEGVRAQFTERIAFPSVSVNQPFRAGVLNLILNDSVAWPAACGVDPGYPTCYSRPRNGIIVCTPAMARLVSEVTPPLDSDRKVGILYLLAVTIGHELGHISREGGADDASHFAVGAPGNRLDCQPIDDFSADIEKGCDEDAVRAACPALTSIFAERDRVPDPPSKSYGKVIDEYRARSAKRTFAEELEIAFERLWPSDKLCLSSYEYESMSARLRHFAAAYVRCRRAEDQHLISEFAQLDERVRRLERYLRTHQRGGWVGSSLYRDRVITAEDATRLEDGTVVFFAKSFALSAITATRPDPSGISVQDFVWRGNGEVVDRRTFPLGVEWYVDEGENSKLRRIRVGCPPSPALGCVAEADDAFDVPKGRVRRTEWGSWVVDGVKDVRVYSDLAALKADRPVLRLKTFDEVAVLDRKPRVAVYAFTNRGLVDVRDGASTTEMDLSTGSILFRTGISDLSALDGRIVFTTQGGSRSELWNCPSTLFADGKAQCVAHETSGALPDPEEPMKSLSFDVNQGLVTSTRSWLRYHHSIQTSPLGCPKSWIVSRHGWTLLIGRNGEGRIALPATGVAGCSQDRIFAYRQGRVDQYEFEWTPDRRRSDTLPSPVVLPKIMLQTDPKP